MQSFELETATGERIAGWDTGEHDRPPWVLIHGIAQSKESFAPLVGGPTHAGRRLIAFDLPGHGDSSSPTEGPSKTRLGEDLHAVIHRLELKSPVLLAWSYGGVVIGEYLRRFGPAGLGGLVACAASVKTGRGAGELFGATMMDHARGLVSADPDKYLESSQAFIEGCSAAPLPEKLTRSAVEAMTKVPAPVRRALLSGEEDYLEELAQSRLPTATLHGLRDTVVLPAMSDLVDARVPDARSVRLEGVGHLPWLEAPDRFAGALDSLG